MTVAERVAAVRERIARAAERAGRDPAGVRLVAVSKTFGADAVLEAARAGVTDFGENRAQELRHKAAAVGDAVTWHFVGHLQSNKVRAVVGVARVVHSVDRPGLAEALARRARSVGVVQDVLVEVNVAAEASKHGCEPPAAPALADEIASYDELALRGVMAIPPLAPDPEASRPHFRALAALRDEIAVRHPGAVDLSMGMSGDFEVAIEEGATIVRVGEAIFGPRTSA
ncbi:MAG TPA: YggS family pyridoxal phosphate-dependent enzyme [Actinomycetota bacterium]|nr:YggS family pyridoxal phosphate-dependent enzyme [Actinomycetota bacterium]